MSRHSRLVAALTTGLLLAVVAALMGQTPASTVNALGYLTNGVRGTGNALAHASPADQTGNATATLKMNGLGAAAAPCLITPGSTGSGRVTFNVTGILNQTTTADGVTYNLAIGTGTPPANAAAATGTIISATPVWTALTGMLSVPFAIEGTASGLAPGVPVWFDLQVAEVTGGTAAIKFVDCTAAEQ